ncbi:MAG: ubiquinol-cytochrome c reductase iron-sulfur subunit [Syntrophobacteraceae bacterium]
MSQEDPIERRAFIKSIALGGAATAIISIPLATYLIAPALAGRTAKWVDLGAIEALRAGQTQMLTYEFLVKDGWLVLPQRGFVWVTKAADNTVQVFSSTCTHLGCNVIWREQERIFECPCHSGRFDAKGQPIGGPPKRPLAVLNHKIEEGKLKVHMIV